VTTIQTERLTLRPYVATDAMRVLETQSRFDVVRWISDPPHTTMKTIDEAHTWIQKWAEVAKGGPYDVGYAIEVTKTGVLAGTVMVVPLPNNDYGERQIGWTLHPDSAGHGYATEAARALLDRTFMAGLEEIWCDMYPDNAPSAAVAERLGLRPLGVVPDPWYGNEGRLFHLTRDQWLERQPRE